MTRRRMWLFSAVTALAAATAALWGLFGSFGEASLQKAKTAVQPADALTPPATATIPKGLLTLRVDFRSKGKAGSKQPTKWDGNVSISRGNIRRIRPWQQDPRDNIDSTQWKITTRRTIPWNAQQRQRGHAAMPLKDSAMVIELADVVPESQLEFRTEQGDFDFTLQEIALGRPKGFLGGLAQVTRTANTALVLSAPSEDDYPAAALGPDGKLYVAYVAFTHGKDFRSRPPLKERLADYGYLDQPAGGDQVLLLRLDGDDWSGPLAVTEPGQDVYRTAMAVDGDGSAWVFWSAEKEGNWDVFARRLDGEKWSDELRLSTAAGPDTFPVAATDSSGKVWVVWQGFRDGNSNILARRQNGSRFDDPITVADTDANLWAPAVAASADGQVAVAWDGYTAGNYDVGCRVSSGGEFGKPIPIATSSRAEMRPSVTFDRQNRLWIAYENSPEGWGKDWGALEKTGTALYQGRTVAVRIWAESKLWQPADEPANAFAPWRRTQPRRGQGQKLAVPRLTTDASGRVWLAVRSPRFGSRVGVGTTWFEHLAWYEGNRWSGEIVCPRTDNILDNRPALVPLPDGKVVMVASTDERFASGARLPQWFVRELRQSGERLVQKARPSKWPDRVNNELMMAELGPVSGGAPTPVELESVAMAEEPKPNAEAKKEAADVARARAERITIAGKKLRLLRGEFHRHTELSPDGGGDGLLLDMWRYGLDATALDWIGNGDHDNGNGREYSWWITQKTTDLFQLAGTFTPMHTYERSCRYPDGHRNVVFDRRGIRPLPRLQGGMGKALDDLSQDAKRPNTPDTQALYEYLRQFEGVCASHTSGTDMGTDWRDNDAKVEPIVEIYQGCRQNYEMPGAPRSNTAQRSLGGWRPFGFVSLALKKGYRLGFQASSDHISTHISYCNVWVEEPTREAILASMKVRHLYGATDNIIADVRCGDHFMGDEFTLATRPKLSIRLIGTQPFAKVHVIKDGNYVLTKSPNQQEVEFEWSDFDVKPGKTSYYYIRGEQTDGELVWVSPMWIKYQP